jgi:hypothetical protein
MANHRMGKTDLNTEIITTIAGTGEKGYGGGGGPALRRRSTFRWHTLSPDGRRMYIADLLNRQIGIDRKTGS